MKLKNLLFIIVNKIVNKNAFILKILLKIKKKDIALYKHKKLLLLPKLQDK